MQHVTFYPFTVYKFNALPQQNVLWSKKGKIHVLHYDFSKAVNGDLKQTICFKCLKINVFNDWYKRL